MLLSRNHHPLIHNLLVYMAKDCTSMFSHTSLFSHAHLLVFYTTVYLKDVEDMFKAEQTGSNTALLLLVPIRLGSDSLNIIYIPCIKVGVVSDVICVDHMISRHCWQWSIVSG